MSDGDALTHGASARQLVAKLSAAAAFCVQSTASASDAKRYSSTQSEVKQLANHEHALPREHCPPMAHSNPWAAGLMSKFEQ